jgi:hypothetical protein
MKRLGSLLAVVVLAGSLVAVLTLTSPQPASGQGQKGAFVTVVNTPAQPVPVDARQAGTWLIRNADERGRQPYHEKLNLYTNDSAMVQGTVPVPEGKRLVVEYLSAYVLGPGPAVVTVHAGVAGAYNQGAWLSVDRIRNSSVPGGLKTYFGGEMVRCYGEPGGELNVTVYVDGATQFNSYISVVGYLVDIP